MSRWVSGTPSPCTVSRPNKKSPPPPTIRKEEKQERHTIRKAHSPLPSNSDSELRQASIERRRPSLAGSCRLLCEGRINLVDEAEVRVRVEDEAVCAWHVACPCSGALEAWWKRRLLDTMVKSSGSHGERTVVERDIGTLASADTCDVPDHVVGLEVAKTSPTFSESNRQ